MHGKSHARPWRGEENTRLFVKRGYTIVRCEECSLVFANPQVDAELVLDEYREGASNDLWVDVLTSPRQLELDREKFADIFDELEPYRGGGALLDVGTSIGLFLQPASERGWHGLGTEFGRRALAYARDELGLEASTSRWKSSRRVDVVALNSVLEHVNRAELLRARDPPAAAARRRLRAHLRTLTVSPAASCTSTRPRSTGATTSSTSRLQTLRDAARAHRFRGGRDAPRGERRWMRCSSGSRTGRRTAVPISPTTRSSTIVRGRRAPRSTG